MLAQLSFLHNKVARRILLSFILAALIPTGILGIFSFHEVRQQLYEQSVKSLQHNCKEYGMKLIDHLLLLQSSLRLASFRISYTKNNPTFLELTQQDFTKQFLNLTLITKGGKATILFGNLDVKPELTKQDIQVIASGKTYIKWHDQINVKDKHLWMAMNVVENQPEAGILIGELSLEAFLADGDFEPNYLWLLNSNGDLLFASETELELPKKTWTQFAQETRGELTWQIEKDDFVAGFWKLPFKTLFYSPDLIIVQGQHKGQVFKAIELFSSVYPPVILLSLLLVIYLSTKFITKYLTPLDKLKAATLRISEGDFNFRLQINTQDEFEGLAESFNEMSDRLGSQFNILSTMAEIDRLILSSLDANEIIETALERLPSILFCDLIAIAQIDTETQQIFDVRARYNQQQTEHLIDRIDLIQTDRDELLTHQNGCIEFDIYDQLPLYLKHFHKYGHFRYLIIPLLINDCLTSIVYIGYRAPKQIGEETRTIARNFGNRITVALSNAAWEEKLFQQAHYDSLTGLPNRLTLYAQLEQELSRAKRDSSQLAVFFIDLDRFKNINDSLGHAAGDQLLQQVAQIFKHCVRETDFVVRIGGDEFVIVLTNIHTTQYPLPFVSAVADKILSSLNQTLIVQGYPVSSSASIGIALFPDDADNIQDLLKNADAAMYHAKSEGRANFKYYSNEMNAAALENIKLEHELRGAIARDELKVYYQSKVDTNQRIVGAEALIRWQHPDLGLISPVKFIPIAEQTGLIVEIGYWVLEQTCLLLNNIIEQGVKPISISINLTAIEFKRPELVDDIATILLRTGVDRQYIELELTESVAIGDITNCITRMHALKELGLKLTMDDFGTGYSSLSYLKDLPLDILKVDQSFVRHLDSDTSSQAIIIAILALAKGLGMETVAEGIETEHHFNFLKQHGCHIFQGYFFSRPIPKYDFIKLLLSQSLIAHETLVA